MASINRFLIISILLLFCLGCSQHMNKSTNLSFSIENNTNWNELSVNIYLYKANSGSRWYGLVKKETIIDHGKLVKSKVNYSDISHYEIFVFTNNFSKVDLTDNIFKDDFMEYYYSFSKDFMNFEINKNNNLLSNGTLYYGKDLKDSMVNKFIFYDANKEKFELTSLGPETLNYLDTMTFEELVETDKLLSKDILKLKKLSFTQKKQLIEAHKIKKFDTTFN